MGQGAQPALTDPLLALASGQTIPSSISQMAQARSSSSPEMGFGGYLGHFATGGLIDKVASAAAATTQPFFSLGPNAVGGDSWSDRYHKTLSNIQEKEASYERMHPELTKYAQLAGIGTQIAIPELKGAAGVTNAVRAAPSMAKTLLTGMGYGGAYGFGSTDDSSLTGDIASTAEGAGLGGLFTIGGLAAGSMIGKGAGTVSDLMSANPQTKSQKLAAVLLQNKMGQQGLSIADIQNSLTGTDKPLTLLDMGGENSPMQRLGRTLVTSPGKSSQQVTDFLNQRQDAARGRVMGDISQHLAPNTDTYGVQADLSKQRSVNSDPLYKQAFASAGVGPIDYEADRNALIAATSQKAQIAKQIKGIEQNSSGALAARGAAGADIRNNYIDLKQQLQQAEGARQAAASKFENTQAGLSAMESQQPLTDSRLNDFMADPDIKAGMQKGLDIQRRTSLAKGEEFDPNAYAISHYDDKGMPVVGPVPTWRTLHAGREGLDATLNEFRDPFTNALPNTKLVNSYKDLRSAYSNHLHTLNPDLAAADAAWSDPSQQKDAITLGQKILGADPEQITAAQARMNPDNIDFHRMGAARAIRDYANERKDTADLGKALIGDQMSRDQLIAEFGPAAAGNFGNAMEDESTMANTRRFVTGNSSTANKAADLSEANRPSLIASILGDAIKGGLTGGLHGAATLPALNLANRAGGGLISRFTDNSGRNLELAKVLTASGASGLQDLSNLLTPAQKRIAISNAVKRIGNTAGVGAVAPLVSYLLSQPTNGPR